MDNTETLLTARGNTHGDFHTNSAISQDIKLIIRETPNWKHLTPFQREGLEMIAHKIGRILAGDPDFNDHWDDIAGYAKITSQRISK